MDRETFDERVRKSLDGARDLLGRIEEAVRENGEQPELLAASRIYARYCMAAREYLHGSQLNRPLPRRYAEKVRGLRDELAPLSPVIAPFATQPTVDDFQELIDAAESLPLRT